MEKLDDEAAAKFISALTKSVQTLCHGFLDFHTGVEILGYINLNVDKGSKLHYVLEEKVCKNEENSTLFISNSFHAQNQKQDKGKDPESESSGSTGAHRSNSTDNGERSRVSSAISSISTALSRSHEKSRVDSTSSAKDAADMVHSRPISNTSKRKASDDLNSDVRSAKSSHMRSSPSPVSHFLSHSQSPHGRTGQTSPIDRKPSVSELRGENSSGTVLPQTAGISGDGAGDIGVNLAGSVLERVDDHSNSDLPDRGDDSDGDLEVTFIKEEYMEGEQSSCQFENSTGQFGRGTNRRASSTDNMPDASLYPISLHPSASATYVPGSQDMASAQHYGPSTSSQPGASGVRGTYPAQSDSSACDQKMLEASQLFQDWLTGKTMTLAAVSALSMPQLDNLLCSFYREVRKRDGTPLKEHVMKRVRSGLMRYLSSLLKIAPTAINPVLQRSNKVYTEMLSKQPARPTLMLTKADCTFLRGHSALGTDNPLSLLRKLWFELQIHFGARRFSPRDMWPEIFVFINDDDDSEYVMLDRDQVAAASHLRFDVKHILVRRRMNATGGPFCPVNALRLYLSKRERTSSNPSDTVPFLQKPNPLWSQGSQLPVPWYTAMEISLCKNHGFIRELCEDVKLSKVYTNMSLCIGDVKQYAECWPQSSSN